jgi:hypothetical protein
MMPFADYVAARRILTQLSVVGGIPTAFSGMVLASLAFAHKYPNLVTATPEEIVPIM